jgi:hypothetical protein
MRGGSCCGLQPRQLPPNVGGEQTQTFAKKLPLPAETEAEHDYSAVSVVSLASPA